MKTIFNDWQIDGYRAKSPCGKFELWIASGFLFFSDYRPHFPKMTLLQGTSLWTRYRIWRQLCKEREQRALKALTTLEGLDKKDV